jgi:restriction system protein
MVVPTFDEMMYPLLESVKDGKIYKVAELSPKIENKNFNLTEEEKKIRLNNGRLKFYDRLLWARTYLKKAGLVTYPMTGGIRITEEGKKVLENGVEKIDSNFLMKYDAFKKFKERTKLDYLKDEAKVFGDLSPQDLIESGYTKLVSEIEEELLEKLKSMNPYLFETVALKLLKEMGYGEFEETSKSGDGGIDGIVSQDALGLEKIYIQCKRFNNHNVREPDIRNFIGAMSSDVSKGIFFTTSDFEEKAIEKAKTAIQKIHLINGIKLAKLMVKYSVGVQIKNSYDIKEIDSDFFEE